MKLHDVEQDVTVVGAADQGEFHIKSSAKAFQILSSGLYSDKILAIVRELSCNAYDSHIENGNKDEPFEVQFPNALAPEFRIRDFGIGLDHEGVMDVYTTYFESTKQDSNDYIGALGLGSKSPFSYTKNFSITAIKDGVKRLYAAVINPKGIPNIVLMDTTDTTEGNGLEVKFAVERQDFSKFVDAGKKVYKWFPLPPIIKGNRFNVEYQEMIHTQIIPGVDIRVHNYSMSGPMARQGVVVYPIKPNRTDIDKDLHDLLDVDFVIDFPVGSLDVAASREELSYIEHTNVNINTRLREIQLGLIDYVKAELGKAKTDWEKILIMHKMRDDTFGPILKAICKNATKLFDTIVVDDGVYGTPNIVIEQASNWDLSRYSTSTRNHNTGEVRLHRESWAPIYSKKDGTGNRSVIGQKLTVHAPKATFFLNDTGKKNCLGRVRLYCKDNQHGKDVYVVVAETKAALAAFKKATGDAPFVSCKDLPEPARYNTKASATTKITLLKLTKNSSSRRYSDSNWTWEQTTQSLVDAADGKKTLYVPLKNRTVLNGGSELDRHGFYNLLDACLRAGLIDEKVVVYGVRKSVIKELTSDYVNFFDAMKKKIASVSVQKITENVKRKSLAEASLFSERQLEHMKTELGSKHVIAVIADAAIGANKITGLEDPSKTMYLDNIATRLDMKLDLDGIEQKAERAGVAMWTDMVDIYPMLAFIHDTKRNNRAVTTCVAEVIKYIKLVDEAA